MTEEERNQKLEEISKTIDEIEAFLAKYGINPDNSVDTDDYEDDYEDEDEDEIEEDYEDEDDDITCEELDGDGVGYGFGFSLDKIFDPRYNEHILSEPDENGMVEISDELYDRLYGKYHSKEDMLSDIIWKLDFYVSGKLAGDQEYWAETRYLGIDKQSNRPEIGTKAQLAEMATNEDREFDIYDIDKFEKCYWTNADDEYADTYEYKLIDDSAIRELIDKYYPELDW